jgi:hypothetical protein
MHQDNRLGVDDLADIAAACGLPVHGRTVARTLEKLSLPGVVRPAHRGAPWRVPRAAVVTVLAAMIGRQTMRERAPQGLGPPSFVDCEVAAAQRLLATEDGELVELVPDELAARAIRQWAEERRRHAEERARAEREEQERALAAARRRQEEREQAGREVRERMRRCKAEYDERLVERCYRICRRVARQDGADDWPPQRPAWWRPPPGLAQEVAPVLTFVPYGYVEPDWRRWMPPHEPGRPWPWRVPGAESGDAAD